MAHTSKHAERGALIWLAMAEWPASKPKPAELKARCQELPMLLRRNGLALGASFLHAKGDKLGHGQVLKALAAAVAATTWLGAGPEPTARMIEAALAERDRGRQRELLRAAESAAFWLKRLAEARFTARTEGGSDDTASGPAAQDA